MADDEDLPDHDYESIYGPEALEARSRARLDAAMLAQRASLRHIEAILAKWEAREPKRGDPA